MTETDPQQVEAWFRDYFEVFSTLDLEAILGHYHAPMILVIPGGVISMKDMEEVRATFSLVVAQYSAGGYGRSGIKHLETRILSEGLAEVGGTAVRYDPDDVELHTFRFRYILRLEGTWKIVAMVNGDPETDPQR